MTVSLPLKRPHHPSSATQAEDLPLTPPETLTIPYEYLVYSLGASLPDPVNLASSIPLPLSSSRTSNAANDQAYFKQTSVARLTQLHQLISTLPVGSRKILVIGGGALGIQLATDILEIYRDGREGEDKDGWEITLLHSREKLLPKFDPRMHDFSESCYPQLFVRISYTIPVTLTLPTQLWSDSKLSAYRLSFQREPSFPQIWPISILSRRPSSSTLRRTLPSHAISWYVAYSNYICSL